MKKLNSVFVVSGVLIASVFFYQIQTKKNSHAYEPKISKNYTEIAESKALVIEAPHQTPIANDNSVALEVPKKAFPEKTLSINNYTGEKNIALESVIESLVALEGGLSYSTAEMAFQLSDFDALVYHLTSKGTSGAFEQNFRDSLHEVTKSSAGVLQRSVGCNDHICAAVLDYSDQKVLEGFYKKLVESIKQPVSIVTQPVELNGAQELRVLINYNKAMLVID